MLTLILIWLAMAIGFIVLSRRSSAGLPFAYFLGVSLIHVPGAMLYMDSVEWDRTLIGFQQTIIGLVSFLTAVMIVRYAWYIRHRYRDTNVSRPQASRREFAVLNRLALLYCVIGGGAYFIVIPFASLIPSATAIVSSLGSLVMVGACLRLWVARECRNWLKFWSTIAFLPLLPLATLVQGGFLGFGTYWVLAIACFLFAQSRWRFGYILLAPAVVFVGMSVFVNYMAARKDIRDVVWSEQSSLGDRLQRVQDVYWNFEWLDGSNLRHRQAIDDRLNQNLLVGVAVGRLETGAVEYAFGTTLHHMLVGLIPRALWPNKPDVGGGGTVVSQFTGMSFAEGTSVGAGQVFEFYVNFGTLGVIVGYLLYGWMFGWMDLWIIESLHRGDQRRFLLWFLVCLALLQPGGNLVEIMVSTISSFITAYGIGYFVDRRWRTGVVPNLRMRQLMGAHSLEGRSADHRA